MTSTKDYHDGLKERRLSRYGFDADPKAVRVHKDETPLHVVCRRLCGYVLQNAGRAWDEEVVISGGDRIDIVDFGDIDEPPLAVEFESVPDQPTTDEKVRKYVKNGPCRDVLVLDLRDAPAELSDLVAWIEGQVVGV